MEKLSIKSLQIGYWLYSIIDRNDHIEKKLCKVIGIRTDSDVPLIQCDDTDVWYPLDSYEPIPLTPEILEKNGFEKWDDGWCIYDQENTGIEIAWNGTILKIGGECGNLELPAIMYVHQLQHALKLCGIEKEIEL